MFNIANVYQNKLKDYKQAISVYESLIKRYPDNTFLLLTYYRLYSLNKDLEFFEKSDYYKKLIINKFPESNYAKVLINPNFFKELQKKQNQINFIYSSTYKYYQNSLITDFIRIKLSFGISKHNNVTYVGYNNIEKTCNYSIYLNNSNKLISKISLNVGKIIVDSSKIKLPKNFKYVIRKDKYLIIEMLLIPGKISDEILKTFIDTCQNIKMLNCE